MEDQLPLRKDWLLLATVWLIQIARLVFTFAGLGLVAALIFTVFGSADRFDVFGKAFVEIGLTFTGRISMGIVFAVSLSTVFLAERFLKTLKDVVETVPEAEPFSPQNAERLKYMAILATSVQSIGLITTSFSDEVAYLTDELGIVFEPSLEGVLFALVLFILARVFGEGAAMREDLKGTV